MATNHIQSKYKAKPVYYDLYSDFILGSVNIEEYRVRGKLKLPDWVIKFDSQLEFNVYIILRNKYHEGHICMQKPVHILPKSTCYPNGKNWKADFAVLPEDGSVEPLFYVEAKGIISREFRYILACLEEHNPKVFNKLYLVFGDTIPMNNMLIKALSKSTFKERICTFKTFKELPKIS